MDKYKISRVFYLRFYIKKKQNMFVLDHLY